MKRFLLFAGALLFAEPAAATAAAPEIFVLSPASPPAGAVQGTLAGTFTSFDRAAASSETWLYDLVAGDGDTDNVRFLIQQDQLVTSGYLSSGACSVRVRASGSSGTAREKVFSLQVGGSSPDSDGDGVPDETESFLGSNPVDPASQSRLAWQLSGDTFRLVFPRAEDLSELDGYIEVSTELTGWRSIAAKEAGAPWVFAPEVQLVDDGSEVEITGPLSDGRRFCRLRAETRGSPPDAADVRAISVIVDFADQALEEYSGAWPVEALKSPFEIQTMLADMEDHWSWMSTGSHRVRWDLIRVRLDQDLRADSFPGWVEFRHAVADKIKARVNPADYDADGDGNIDMCFFIVSNNDGAYDYLVGGASTINGVNSFSDGQGSDSVRARAIGNFNHEAGHNLGLVDLYGTHDTVKYLSLMSDSWPVPPFGFSAFDRCMLGWITLPVIVDSTTVVLNPAEGNLEAVKIPTEVATEYFLIEYRKKPAAGFGSATDWAHPAFDGLAIYHIDETELGTGNNGVVPPLMKLETPAGTEGWDQPPATQDFWYPGNPAMTGAFLAKPYYAPSRTLFRVQNIEWQGDAIRFSVEMMPTGNLVLNPDFTDGLDHWTPDDFSHAAVYQHHATGGPDGSACASIEIGANGLDDARFVQRITGLTPGGRYILSGYIKGENIELPEGAQMGANFSIMGGFINSGTVGSAGSFGWKPFSVMYVADDSVDDIAARLGFYGSVVRGKAWFDKVSLVAVSDDD